VVIRRRLAESFRFLGRVLRKTHRDEVGLRASALAFSTLIALVPLLAVITIFVARTLREDDGRILELLTQLLPYREESVLAALRSFLSQAESVSGLAVIGFVVTSLLTFFGVQESLFYIFRVERSPSIFRRLVTFSMLVIWGPILVGSAQAGLLVLGQSSPEAAQLLRNSPLLQAMPAVLTFVGLTMLYWRAAFRRISLRHAAIGSATATVLLELLKAAFGVYLSQFTAVQRAVYGTFAIAFFFVLSIQLAWWILLLGAELAACLRQEPEAETSERPALAPDPWIGLAALERLGAAGRPTVGHAELERELELAPEALVWHLEPLLSGGIVLEQGGDDPAFRLALPTRQLRLAAVFAAYRRRRDSADADSGTAPPATRELATRLGRATEFELGAQTLAGLLGQEEPRELLVGDSESTQAVDLEATQAVDPFVPTNDREPR